MSRKATDEIRELAGRVAEIARSDRQEELRDRWSRHNNLEAVDAPPVLVRPLCRDELFPPDSLVAEDTYERAVERKLRELVYHHEFIGDDTVIEPWYDLPAVPEYPRETMWGVPVTTRYTGDQGGSFEFLPQIKEESDIEKLRVPSWKIDERATQHLAERTQELLRDELPVRLMYGMLGYGAALAYWGSYLRGLNQMLIDIYDRPQWLRRLFRFLSEAHMAHLQGLREDGHIVRNDNGYWGHCRGLPQPDFDGKMVRFADCWGGGDSQEFDMVSPAAFEQFLLQYQRPVLDLFGLVSYGCCESLTHKYGLLKRHLKNLRRVSCSPWSDPRAAAEELGDQYVIQWRPNPSHVIFSFTPDQMRRDVRRAMEILKGCHVDMCLQDVQTVNGEPWRLRAWAEAARLGAEDAWG